MLVSLFNKFAGPGLLQHKCFPVNFLKISFFTEHLQQLLLNFIRIWQKKIEFFDIRHRLEILQRKLKVSEFWVLNASFGEVTGEELVGKVFIISWGRGEGSFYKNRKKELWFFGGKCHNSVHLWVELKYCFRSNQENKSQNFSLRSLSFMCCRWIVCQSVLIPRNSHALRKFWGLIVILEQFIGGKTCNGAQLVAVGERGLPFFENWKRVLWFWKKYWG